MRITLSAYLICFFLSTQSLKSQDYTPTKETVPDISRYKARLMLAECLKKCKNKFYYKMGGGFDHWGMIDDPLVKDNLVELHFYFESLKENAEPYYLYYASIPNVSCLNNKRWGFHIIFPDSKKKDLPIGILYLDKDLGKQIADILFILKNKDQNVSDKMEVDSFLLIAQQYRSLVIKPDLNENARRFLVQATTATEEKRYVDAIDLLEKAIAVEPAYPQAHFNRALLWAQVNIYGAAILEMKKYLMLAPDAPDARASQDKVYEWEGKLNK